MRIPIGDKRRRAPVTVTTTLLVGVLLVFVGPILIYTGVTHLVNQNGFHTHDVTLDYTEWHEFDGCYSVVTDWSTITFCVDELLDRFTQQFDLGTACASQVRYLHDAPYIVAIVIGTIFALVSLSCFLCAANQFSSNADTVSDGVIKLQTWVEDAEKTATHITLIVSPLQWKNFNKMVNQLQVRMPDLFFWTEQAPNYCESECATLSWKCAADNLENPVNGLVATPRSSPRPVKPTIPSADRRASRWIFEQRISHRMDIALVAVTLGLVCFVLWISYTLYFYTSPPYTVAVAGNNETAFDNSCWVVNTTFTTFTACDLNGTNPSMSQALELSEWCADVPEQTFRFTVAFLAMMIPLMVYFVLGIYTIVRCDFKPSFLAGEAEAPRVHVLVGQIMDEVARVGDHGQAHVPANPDQYIPINDVLIELGRRFSQVDFVGKVSHDGAYHVFWGPMDDNMYEITPVTLLESTLEKGLA